MAFFGFSGMTSFSNLSARRQQQASSTSNGHLTFGPALPGTGFENPPPLPIITGIFQFLKFVGLSSVGLEVVDVPFHRGWVLVEWRPFLSVAEWIEVEFDRIYEEIETEEKSVGQIDLNLDFSLSDEEPPVEVPGVVPTVVVEDEEEEFLLEVEVSTKETKSNQAEGTGRPIPEDAKKRKEETVVETGKPVPDVEKSGESPDPMEVDPAVRTGGSFVGVEEREAVGADPDLGSGMGVG